MFGKTVRHLMNSIRTGPTRRFGVDFIEIGSTGMADVSALRSSAVWACVHKIAARAGAAEYRVARYQRDTASWREMPNHALNALFRSPSPRLPAYLFWRTLAEHVLTTGNGYAVLGERDAAFRPLYLLLSSPANVTITRDQNGLPTYTGQLPEPGGGARRWTRPFDGVAHVRGPHLDIASGRSVSPVQCAAASIGLQSEAMDTARASMRNSTRFTAVLKTAIPGSDSEETQDYIRQLRDDHDAAAKKGGLLITPHGIDYSTLPGMQRDMQLAGDLNWSVQDIARIYGVPLALIQHTAGARQDIEQLEDGLLRDAVWPVLHSTAAALTVSCLSGDERMAGYAVRPHIDTGGPTPSGKVQMAMVMGQTGAVTINEVRRVVGLAPMEGGDELPQTAGAGEREDPADSEPDNEPEEPEEEGDEDTE